MYNWELITQKCDDILTQVIQHSFWGVLGVQLNTSGTKSFASNACRVQSEGANRLLYPFNQ